MKNIETREGIELRIDQGAEDAPPKIVGYAAVFDSLSKDLGGFREKIQQGAFATSIENKDEVRALFNHDSDMLLGRLGSGTLRLWEDKHGLGIEIDPPNTNAGRDVVELLRRGDLASMSFGFFDTQDSWETDEQGGDIRTINSARLFDVSVVTSPAYEATSVTVRHEQALKSLEEYRKEVIEQSTNFDAVGETVDIRLRLRLAETSD